MVLVAFNKKFINNDTDQQVEANTPIEMTVKRADEIVKNIKGVRKDYEDFGYERVKTSADEKDQSEKETDKEPPVTE